MPEKSRYTYTCTLSCNKESTDFFQTQKPLTEFHHCQNLALGLIPTVANCDEPLRIPTWVMPKNNSEVETHHARLVHEQQNAIVFVQIPKFCHTHFRAPCWMQACWTSSWTEGQERMARRQFSKRCCVKRRKCWWARFRSNGASLKWFPPQNGETIWRRNAIKNIISSLNIFIKSLPQQKRWAMPPAGVFQYCQKRMPNTRECWSQNGFSTAKLDSTNFSEANFPNF